MKEQETLSISHRRFPAASALGALGMGLTSLGKSVLASGSSAGGEKQVQKTAATGGHPCNILFILTDQERYFPLPEYPAGYTLPSLRRVPRRGVIFTNHLINSAVCTSSRSVIYKGKWHLSRELGTHDEYALPQEKLTQVIESYGFKDYIGIGDVIGETRGGYLNDEIIGAQARRWLRLRGLPMRQKGAPRFLAVNLVNPHDVMFYNTDAPGQNVQSVPKPLNAIAREPDTTLYSGRGQAGLCRPPARQESDADA